MPHASWCKTNPFVIVGQDSKVPDVMSVPRMRFAPMEAGVCPTSMAIPDANVPLDFKDLCVNFDSAMAYSVITGARA